MNTIGGFVTSKFSSPSISAGGLKSRPAPDQATTGIVKSTQHTNSSNLIGTIALIGGTIGCASIATVMGLLAFGAYKIIKSPLTYLSLFARWVAKKWL